MVTSGRAEFLGQLGGVDPRQLNDVFTDDDRVAIADATDLCGEGVARTINGSEVRRKREATTAAVRNGNV